MPDVTVGVKKWAGDREAKRGEKVVAEIGAYWVKVGDTMLTADDDHLVSVKYEMDSSFAMVTITFPASSFKTVDYRKKPK